LGEKGAGCFFEVKITLRGQKGIENSVKGRKEIGKNGSVTRKEISQLAAKHDLTKEFQRFETRFFSE